MDDFLTGPHSFDLYIDSYDSSNFKKPYESAFSIILNKPLEFVSGNWEVCLKQIIFAPNIHLISPIEGQITVMQRENGKKHRFKLNLSDLNLKSQSHCVEAFNLSIPIDFKDKILMTTDDNYSKLILKNVHIQFESNKLANIFGFRGNQFYPNLNITNASSSNAEVLSHVSFNVNNGYQIFKVLTDFTAPVNYGSTFLPIIGIGILKANNSNAESYNFYNGTYVPIIKSYISKLSITIADWTGQPLPLHEALCPIILKLNFRLKTVI